MYPPFPPSFHLGPLTIHWYGITMVTAIFVAALIASRYVARHGQDSNTIWSMLLWVVIPAIICARLYYVFIQAPRGPDGLGNYLAHPWLIFAIWQGGIHIYGALIGGGIALLTYMYVNKLPPLIYLDGVGLGLLLGQAIGRLGNFMNQELYGPPTTLPWGLRIDPQYRLAPYDNLALYPESVRFQPLFLYEMIWNLLGFALLFWISRRYEKKLRDGDLVLMYLIWYPFGRFFLEFFRSDSWFFPGTPFNLVHLLSAIVIIASIAVLIARHRNWAGRPAAASLALSGVTDGLVEEEPGESGISSSEEYTFLNRKRPERVAEELEEVALNRDSEDEEAQAEAAMVDEEGSGIEGIEVGASVGVEEEGMFEEEEEDESEEAVRLENQRRGKEARVKDEDDDDEEEREEEESEQEDGEDESEDVDVASAEEAGQGGINVSPDVNEGNASEGGTDPASSLPGATAAVESVTGAGSAEEVVAEEPVSSTQSVGEAGANAGGDEGAAENAGGSAAGEADTASDEGDEGASECADEDGEGDADAGSDE